MLSVLIPTYNYNISKLPEDIHKQIVRCKIPFEILVYEDGSTENINNLDHLTYSKVLKNTTNIGRVKSRQFLAETAKYDWLLFLDADVIPKTKNFILHYLNISKEKYDIIYGGIAYKDEKPKKEFLLRWKYGRLKEQVIASKRNLSPYKNTSSGNFLVKKKVFLAINSMIKKKGYGNDNYFGALLKDRKIPLLHIDNNVYHLGLENSNDYITKKEQAAKTLLNLYNSNTVSSHDNGLLNLYSIFKKYYFTIILSTFFKLFKNIMRSNLMAGNPSIFILQLYRISFMCYSHHKNK